MKRIQLLFFSCFLLGRTIGYGQDLFDSTHTRSYAQFLLTTHQYKQASEEFNRLYFFSNQNPQYLPALMYALRKSDQESVVLQRFNAPTQLDDAAFKQFIYCMVKTNKTPEAITLVESRTNLDTNMRNNLLGMSYIDQYRWKEATKLFTRMSFAEKDKVLNILTETQHSGYKNKYLAAGLSAVVPGLGKLYTGNKKDALMSLIFVGVNGFQSYRYFNKKGVTSVGAWVFGSLATGFYLGNIYGAYKAAIHKNKKINDAYKKQIFELTDLD